MIDEGPPKIPKTPRNIMTERRHPDHRYRWGKRRHDCTSINRISLSSRGAKCRVKASKLASERVGFPGLGSQGTSATESSVSRTGETEDRRA
ncbi:hypothetical protein K0M31_002710 [Melipona bicolor]|uniref:Uncharacterized protein n=1 Tax=Melipona bicolor TaxID=60889 RepID=A0AA40G018_9HYME|nr:hypothetical protein K0M31_002710 [Melipona bicolor]